MSLLEFIGCVEISCYLHFLTCDYKFITLSKSTMIRGHILDVVLSKSFQDSPVGEARILSFSQSPGDE